MTVNENNQTTNEEPIEDGLSALRRLAALDSAGGAPASQQDASSQTDDIAEKMPDWLELLLAKYGEEASKLVGVGSGLVRGLRPEDSTDDSVHEETSEVAVLLEQMAAEEETRPSSDELPTSVDWGRPEPVEDEITEDQAPDWLDQIAVTPITPPAAPVSEEESPDWLSELGQLQPEAETPTEPMKADEGQVDSEDVPDWLQELSPTPESAVTPRDEEEPPVTETPTAEGEVTDWLSDLEVGQPDIEAQPAEEIPPAPVDEIPDWMHELTATTPGVEPSGDEEKPPLPEGEVPDWLSSLGVPTPQDDEALPARQEAKPTEPEAEVPDWLQELQKIEAGPGAELTSPEPPEVEEKVSAEPDEEIPDWLRELGEIKEASDAEVPTLEPPPEVAEEAPVEPEAEVPDWLASLRAEAPLPLEMATEEEAPSVEMTEEPDWLAELRATTEPDVLALGEEVVEAEEEELPDWLAELKSSQAAAEIPTVTPEVPEEIPVETEAGEIEEVTPIEFLPAETEPPEAEEIEPQPIGEEYPGEEESGALDWLAEIEAAAAAVTDYAEAEAPSTEAELPPAPEEDLEVEEAPVPVEGIAPGEVPDWLLKQKPEEAEPVEPSPEEVVESEGVLAGIPGLLPVVEDEPEGEEDAIAALRAGTALPAVPDVEGAQVFKEVAAEPSEEAQPVAEEVEAEPETRRRRTLETLVWGVIFIVLIAAIALVLVAVLSRVGDLLGGAEFGEFFGSPLVIDPAPVNTFRAEVNKLTPDDVVVVSFDYSPATEAEMGPLAQIILHDLLENQARVIGVSLRPEGAAMAQRLFDRFDSEYPYGQRTINLGYLPGQAAGVRSLAFLSSSPLFQNGAQTLEDYPNWQDVDSLSDVSLIVTIADSPLAVRWWVEQMGPGTFANRPMVAAVSTAVDPTVRPYYNDIDPKSGQLLGLISGVTGAAVYEKRLEQSGRATQSLAAQSVAQLGLVVVGLAGAVVGFRKQATKG